MLQLNHDAELLVELHRELLVHRLFEPLDCHVLHASVLVRVLAFQHLAVVALDNHTGVVLEICLHTGGRTDRQADMAK